MNLPSEVVARAYLLDLHARHGWPGSVDDEDVARLAALVQRAVAEERLVCADIADDMARLCGSHASEQIADRIRARGEAGDQVIR